MQGIIPYSACIIQNPIIKSLEQGVNYIINQIIAMQIDFSVHHIICYFSNRISTYDYVDLAYSDTFKPW